MEQIQDFFEKLECDPEFLKNYFDNFVLVYGLIFPMGPVLSKITPVANSNNIEYVLQLSAAAQLNMVNYNTFREYNGTTINLYGSSYVVDAIVRGTDLVLHITEV